MIFKTIYRKIRNKLFLNAVRQELLGAKCLLANEMTAMMQDFKRQMDTDIAEMMHLELQELKKQQEKQDKLYSMRFNSIDKVLGACLWQMQKNAGESIEDCQKRFFATIPNSIHSFQKNYNLPLVEAVYALGWREPDIPYEDLDYIWRYLLENCDSDYWSLFESYTFFLFQHGDLLGNLEGVFDERIDCFSDWTERTKLRYISFLLWKGNEQKACQYLGLYMRRHGERNVELFIPVAALAKKHFHVQNAAVMESAKKYEALVRNEHVFSDLVSSKKVAIIGNGTQEIASGNGKKIDAYDVVIRINDYRITDKTSADYGSKVTVWANCSDPDNIDFPSKGNYQYFMYLPDVFSESLDGRFVVDSDDVCTVDILSLRKRTYKETGLYCASNGLLLIKAVKELNESFSEDDCYGFSFKDEDPSGDWIHYFPEGNITKWTAGHSLPKEKAAIQNIILHR